MYKQISVLGYDKNDNVIFIVFYKIKSSLKFLCKGKFNFTNGWCGIFNTTPFLLTDNGFNELIDCLEQRDWNIFHPAHCCKEIKSKIRKYNKLKHGKYNPFRRGRKSDN